VRGEEVAHADRAGALVRVQLLERAPGFEPQPRHGPVNQIQINVLETEALQAALESAQRGVIPLVLIPELGGDEYFGARDAGVTNRLTHLVLVAVHARGVHVAIPLLQGLGDRAHRTAARLPNAQADLGYVRA